MWFLILSAFAGADCPDFIPRTSNGSPPTTIRGSITLAGEKGSFVQYIDGDRFYMRIEAGSFRETDLVIGEHGWNLDSNGRLQTGPADPLLVSTYRFESDLSGFSVDGEDCRELISTAPDGRPVRLQLDPVGRPHSRILPSQCFPSEIRVETTDYREVDGVPFPFTLELGSRENAWATLAVESVTRSVPEAAFAPLEAQPNVVFPKGPAEVPLVVRDERIYIPVEISGSAGQLKGLMMLDTGWASTSIDTEAAKEVGWQGQGWNLATSPTGSVKRSTGRLRAIRIGTMEIDSPRVSTLPLQHPLEPGERMLGVLGVSAMKGLIVQIDYSTQQARFSLPADFQAPPKATALPMPILCGTPAVRASLGPIDGMWRIDTGAYQSLEQLDEAGFTAALERFPDRVPASITTASGGSDDAWEATLKQAQIGPYSVQDPGLVLLHSAPSPYTPLIGNLGHRLLHCFDLTLDFDSETLLLEPAGSLDRCALPPRSSSLSVGNLLCGLVLFSPLALLLLGIYEHRRRRARLLRWSDSP